LPTQLAIVTEYYLYPVIQTGIADALFCMPVLRLSDGRRVTTTTIIFRDIDSKTAPGSVSKVMASGIGLT